MLCCLRACCHFHTKAGWHNDVIDDRTVECTVGQIYIISSVYCMYAAHVKATRGGKNEKTRLLCVLHDILILQVKPMGGVGLTCWMMLSICHYKNTK